ncbi:MAG: hypothetical protein ACE5LU_17405, partial [Anaerolineae bacterium]
MAKPLQCILVLFLVGLVGVALEGGAYGWGNAGERVDLSEHIHRTTGLRETLLPLGSFASRVPKSGCFHMKDGPAGEARTVTSTALAYTPLTHIKWAKWLELDSLHGTDEAFQTERVQFIRMRLNLLATGGAQFIQEQLLNSDSDRLFIHGWRYGEVADRQAHAIDQIA